MYIYSATYKHEDGFEMLFNGNGNLTHFDFHAGQITDLLNWMTFVYFSKATLFKEISTKLVTHPR